MTTVTAIRQRAIQLVDDFPQGENGFAKSGRGWKWYGV